MGVELLKNGVQIRKCVIFSIRTCYGSVCKHPFLVGMLLFLIFLYRSFPFVFSFLVSASPVLVCTAVLLGTLLSFGHPNLPEIEKEEKTTHETVSLKTEVPRDAVIVEKDESERHAVERYTEKRRDVVEKSIEEESLTENEIIELKKDDNVINTVSRENSQEIQFEKEIVKEAERELCDFGFEEKSRTNEDRIDDMEVVENKHSRTQVQGAFDENLKREKEKAPGETIDTQKTDHLDCYPDSPWKRLEEGEEEDDEASDSGSDRAESSSPDASMVDIIPMLEELHPLLEEDAPQPVHVSHDGSDAASEHSPCSNESDDNNDEEEEEETHGEKEDASKSAITWTEDDQKNLMDLGTSELERNQRLENLIARRRARMMTEKNLIDFDGVDHPFNIPPISTTRRNPFDVPASSNELPVPGSAPSILLPRRNPFDLPYDSSEEKPDLMEDSFQQEFITFPSKEPFFRRHESFNVGPLFLGTSRQERQDFRLRPYFLPDRMASEGTNYSIFQRQSSNLSESKESSVPETESVSSAEDVEDKKHMEEKLSQEPESITSIEHATEHVGHGSQYSEDVEYVELGQVEKRDIQVNEIEIKSVNVEYHLKMESNLFGTGNVANSVELSANEIHLDTEAIEQKYSCRSSSSSASEENEKIFVVKEDEESSTLEPKRGNLIEEPSISTQTSLEKSDFAITKGLVDEIQHKEPVYDSSPPSIKKTLSSSSSISFDAQETGFLPVLVKRTISFTERKSRVSDQSMEKNTPANEQMLDSLELHTAAENESGFSGISETGKHDMNFRFSVVDPNSNVASALRMPESVVEHSSIDPRPYSETSMVGNFLYKDECCHHADVQVPSSSFDADVHAIIDQDVGEKVESTFSNHHFKPSEGHNVASALEEHSLTHPNTYSFGTKSMEEHLVGKELGVHFIPDETHSSNSEASHVEASEKLVFTQDLPLFEEKSTTQSEKELPLSNEHMSVSSSKNHEKLQESSNMQLKSGNSPGEVSSANDLNVSEVQEHFRKGANNSHDYVQNMTEDVDEIKEIDEGFLAELDTVGDFSVKDLRSNMDEIEKHPIPDGESLFLPHDIETNSVGAVEDATIEFLSTEVIISGENFSASRGEEEINEHKEIGGGPEFRVSRESSLKHVDSSAREAVWLVVENPSDLKSINESQPNKIEIEHSEFLTKQALNSGENSPCVPVDEASIKDIESIPRAESTKVETEFGESEISHNDQIEAQTDVGMPVLEAQSLEDIDSAFKEIREKAIEKSVVIESVSAKLPSDEIMAGPSKDGTLQQVLNVMETKLELPVVDARSIEDIDLAFKYLQENSAERSVLCDSVSDDLNVVASQDRVETSSTLHTVETSPPRDTHTDMEEVSGGNPQMLHSDSQDGSAGLKVNKSCSSEDIKSSGEESHGHKTGPSTAEKPDQIVETAKDLSEAVLKADKSGSSSSSSSSNSDEE